VLKLVKGKTDDNVTTHPTAEETYTGLFKDVIDDIEKSGEKPLAVMTAVYLEGGLIIFGRTSDGATGRDELWLLEQFYYKHKRTILNGDDF